MFRQALTPLLLSGFFGWVSAIGLAAALALTVGMCATWPRVARRGGLLRRLRASTIGFLVVGCAAAGHVWVDARRTMLSVELPQGAYPFWGLSPRWRSAALQVESSLLVIGVALLLAAIVAIVPDARERAPSAGRSRVVRGYAAGVAAVMAMGILWRAAVATRDLLRCEHAFAICVDHARLAAAAPIAAARTGVLVLTVAAVVCVVAFAVRNRHLRTGEPARGSGGLLRAGLVFTLGVAAYQGTRAEAHDTAHPLAAPGSAEAFCAVTAGAAPALPRAVRCGASMEGPVLDMMGRVPAIDGVQARSASELLELLRAKRRLWTEVTGRPLPALVLAAPSGARMDDLAPHLSAVRDVWGLDVAAMSVTSRMELSTKSAGKMALQPRCCLVRLRLAARSAATASPPTWGAVVQLAAGAPTSVAVER